MKRRAVRNAEHPRIAFVTTVHDRTDVGGGTFVHYLRQAVEAGRLDLTFFSDDMQSARAPYERRVRIPANVGRLPGGFITRAWYYQQAIETEHATQPFDLVWHNNVLTSCFSDGREPTLPIVGMINDYNNAESRTPWATREKFGGYRAFVRFGWHQLERYAARRADYLVVNSAYMADLIQRVYGTAAARMKLLYKGVDLQRFTFVRRGAFSAPIRLLFVKNDYVRGGLFDLLDALKNFPVEVQLTIIGPPQEAHVLIRQAALESAISSVRVMGAVDRNEMPRYFQDHDVLCVPSRSEALGVVFMEALASGLPVIGTTAGGIPEVLDDGRAGWLAEPQQPASLRQTLLDVLAHEEDRLRKVQHGRNHVRRFSHEHMIDRMLEIASSIHHQPTLPITCS